MITVGNALGLLLLPVSDWIVDRVGPVLIITVSMVAEAVRMFVFVALM